MCTNMIRSFAIIFLLAPNYIKAQDYDWFEDSWISDAEATIAINPEYRDSDEEILTQLRMLYGKIRWVIEGNNLTFIDPIATPTTTTVTTFTIRPINSASFDIVFEESLAKADSENPFDFRALDNSELERSLNRFVVTISKTETGFCMIRNPNYIVKADGTRAMLKYECFELYDT